MSLSTAGAATERRRRLPNHAPSKYRHFPIAPPPKYHSFSDIQDETNVDNALVWDGNWAWSLPLIVVNIMFHVIGLAFINDKFALAAHIVKHGRNSLFVSALVMGVTTLLVTLLHSIEAGIWAGVYLTLGALPDGKSALLYSLGAMTTYGHEPYYLADHWRLMGTLEALNGMILLGLTTAFLFSTLRELWPSGNRA
jgi:hypothetical protein